MACAKAMAAGAAGAAAATRAAAAPPGLVAAATAAGAEAAGETGAGRAAARRAAILLLAGALAGCGGPVDQRVCSTDAGCTGGLVCSPGGLCVADAVPPKVSITLLACEPPCSRDATLQVVALAGDDHRLAGVEVETDLAPGRRVALPALSPGVYGGPISIAGDPFPGLAREVAVTAVARDASGNEARSAPRSRPVSRIRWVHDAGAPLTGAAVDGAGTVYVGVAAPSDLLAVAPTGTPAWRVKVGGGPPAAPAAGRDAIFVGNGDGTAFAVGMDGAIRNGAGCATGGPISAPPALAAGGELAFFASGSGAIFSCDAGGTIASTGGADPYFASIVVGNDGALYGASGSLLRSFSFASPIFRERWTGAPPPPYVGAAVSAGPAIDRSGTVWTASRDGLLTATSPGGQALAFQLPSGRGGALVILADGSLVTDDAADHLLRISPDGRLLWSSPPALGAAPGAPLVMAGGEADLVVPTADGRVVGLRAADGAGLWSWSLDPGSPLREPTTAPLPSGATVGYFPSASGRLYAVTLDGHLDGRAPWPKAFHDPAGTGDAATPLP